MDTEYKTLDGNRVVPLFDAEDVSKALHAGARVEYTACGHGSAWSGANEDRYDMNVNDGGWVRVDDGDFRGKVAAHAGQMLRAVYPREGVPA